jgi:hypothetical protein
MEVWILLDSATKNITETVESIKKNTCQPTKIIDAHTLEFIDALKVLARNSNMMKMNMTNIWVLSICGPIPRNLIAFYLEFILQEKQEKQEKVFMYGLSGFVMCEDHDISLDMEFKALTENKNYNFEKKCKVSVARTNTHIVHWLERYATMMIPCEALVHVLEPFLIEPSMPELSLCNFLASKNIQCMQLCTLALNVIMLEKQGYIDYVLNTNNPKQKETDVNRTIRNYQDAHQFYLWN